MNEFAIDPSLPGGLPPDPRGTVATVGTFDGVHRGHWAVLQEIRGRAFTSGRRGVLVTFHPHPLRILRPASAPRLLTTPAEKKEILAESGLNYAVFLSFTPVLARYSPRRFVEEILVRRLGVRELVIGYDHGFGHGRSGDAVTLRELGVALKFDVDVVAPVEGSGHAVSSTAIRRALEEGDVRGAAGALGRPYSVRGPVVRGDGRGRKLGFPTANIYVSDPDKLIPKSGIYAVRGVLRCGTFDGALHLGPRPTFGGSAPTIELHLMDFDSDIYGEDIRVDFVEQLREVRPFATVEELTVQMREDVDLARAMLRR